jgi:hypothetical protein
MPRLAQLRTHRKGGAMRSPRQRAGGLWIRWRRARKRGVRGSGAKRTPFLEVQMTLQGKVLPVRELTEAEIALVAGGEITDAEIEITSMYSNSTITSIDGNAAYSEEGVMFLDGDGDSWYDYAEMSVGGELFVYDAFSHSWECRDSDWWDSEDEDHG